MKTRCRCKHENNQLERLEVAFRNMTNGVKEAVSKKLEPRTVNWNRLIRRGT